MTGSHHTDNPPHAAPAASDGVAAYRIADLLLDPDRRSIWRAGEELQLAGLSFDLLLALVRRAPATVPIATLMQEVWPGLVVGNDTLSQRIKLVRAALADSAEEPQYIANVRGRGYRLVAPVEALATMPVPGSITPAPAAPAPATLRRPRLAMGLVLAAAALAVTAFMSTGRQQAMTDDPEALAIYQRARAEVRALGVTDAPELATAIEEELATAIRRDARFGLAYIERFHVRSLRFMFSWGDPEVLMAQMLEDLDAARRLIPASGELLAAAGTVASFNQEYQKAMAGYDAAEQAGLVDPHAVIMRAGVMMQTGRMEQALPLIDRAIGLQENPAQDLLLKGVVQGYLHRPAEALQTFQLAAAADADSSSAANALIGYTRFQFTGLQSSVPPESVESLVSRGQIEAARALARAQPERVPGSRESSMLIPVGVGAKPLRALSEGQVALLTNDQAGAIRAGRAIAAFLGSERETRYNRWYRKNLAAVALLLQGDKAAAIQAAQDAMDLAPRSASAINWAIAASRAATTLAWAGAHDQALDLLDKLAESVPGLPPAEISRSLELQQNLVGNPRYRALVDKLEAGMERTQL